MGWMMVLARGWGMKGNGLKLLTCMAVDNDKIDTKDGNNKGFWWYTGEVAFKCYLVADNRDYKTLVVLYVSMEDLLLLPNCSIMVSPRSALTVTSAAPMQYCTGATSAGSCLWPINVPHHWAPRHPPPETLLFCLRVLEYVVWHHALLA